MTTPIVSKPQEHGLGKEFGFSAYKSEDWSNYLANRPTYTPSFFQRIYDYHSQKAGASWSVAHETGAGCGVVSSVLAGSFDNVVVSDPNDGYVALARELLVERAPFPESKFQFFQETSEESSVASKTVDLVAACECIHWTTPHLAIKEFWRELKASGTLAITYYTHPYIEGNERASKAWTAAFDVYSTKLQDGVYARVPYIVNNALDGLEFPEEYWESVKRIYINTTGDTKCFMLKDVVTESRVKESEEKIWTEDEDWCDTWGFDQFKGYYSTWLPAVPESEVQDIWDELERALEGKQVKIKTPLVVILATKRT
ncbi:S-adenosyl-L-methionine-dependent methyltransferase [Daldinia sp. FL1419]|nr:S-adenosyl-L-methionine-dependent methyltransferase [Daldinia sp. FL1419]